MDVSVKAMAAALSRWASSVVDEAAIVRGVSRMPGHSGITFGFDVEAGGEVDRLVIRVPPAGVRRSGITDVVRQAPLLDLMGREGVPVPRVRWWGEDERWFGVPYLIVQRVAGATLGNVFTDTTDVPDASALFGQAMDALAHIHRADWRDGLSTWDAPRPLAGEIDRYLPLLRKSPEPAWIAAGARLAATLSASAPADAEPAVVHNDFYSNNWMFDRGALTGVLDWEGSFIGPPMLDVGWVCMMYDLESWSEAHRARIAWSPPTAFLVEAYEAASGARVVDLDWYRAFAGYRLASLSAYYLDLHRRGRRPDPIWETLAESVPFMLRRAAALV